MVRPYAAALDVLTEGMPERQREGAVEIVLDGLELGFGCDGESLPRWVEALRVVTRRRMAALGMRSRWEKTDPARPAAVGGG